MTHNSEPAAYNFYGGMYDGLSILIADAPDRVQILRENGMNYQLKPCERDEPPHFGTCYTFEPGRNLYIHAGNQWP